MNTPPPVILVYMTVKSCATQWQTTRHYFNVVGYACVCNKDALYIRTFFFSFFKGYHYFIISSWVSQRNKTRHTWQDPIKTCPIIMLFCVCNWNVWLRTRRFTGYFMYVTRTSCSIHIYDLPNQMVLQLNAIRLMYLLSRYNVHVSKSA